MVKFKVGDKIRVKEDDIFQGLEKGKEYTVFRVDDTTFEDGRKLIMVDANLGYFDFRFELVKKEVSATIKKDRAVNNDWGF